MQKSVWFWGSIVSVIFFFNIVQANERATPGEVIQKVGQAAEFLSKSGDEGLKEFGDPNGRWVWKDTYVWVLHCSKMTNAAHPLKPKLVGMDLAALKDIKGSYFFIKFCEAAKNEKGGWVEYYWPKKGERRPSRKISYILQVPGTEYQVGAGIYNDNTTIERLSNLIK